MDTFVSRRAALLGATGLVGRALLTRLLADPRYGEVHVYARRPMDGVAPQRRLQWHVTALPDLPSPLRAVDDVYCCLGTTRRVAGSDAAFAAIDRDLVVDCARTLRREAIHRT